MGLTRRILPISVSVLVSLFAQVNTGSLTGIIQDVSGAAVPGAKVTIRSQQTNFERTTQSDDSGNYLFPGIPIGPYEVSVDASGFQRDTEKFTLEAGQRGRLDLRLAVAGFAESVTVEAASPRLSTDDASVSSVVDNTYVSKFPLYLRSWDDLLNLVPGVQGQRYTEQSGATSAGRTGGFNVHGIRQLQNNYILDGVDNNSISENVQELTTQVVRPSVDAIQEFRVITNPYSAEYGRSPGAAINVVTKGGTNLYHGVVYEYLRNRVLDANDFFSNKNGLAKPQNVQNQFGGNIGGPVIKDKLFGFFDYEGTRVRRGVSRIATTLNPNERTGDFSAAAAARLGTTYPTIYDPLTAQPFSNNQIPQERIDPATRKLISLFPDPNLPGATNNFTRNAGLLDDVDRYNGRADWTVSSIDNLFVRYTYTDRSRFIPGFFGGIADGTSTSAWGRQSLTAHGVALGWNHILSARMVNEFRAGFGRNNSSASQDPFGLNKASDYVPGIPDNPTVNGGVPRTTFSGFNTFIGSPDFLPKAQVPTQYQFADTLYLSLGRHNIKLGADLRAPLRNNYLDVPGTRGSLNFDRIFTCQRNASNQCVAGTGLSYADALLGYVQSAQLSNVYLVDQRLHMYSFFGQDDIRVTPRLTLNLGLRYDFATPPLEGKNRVANFNPSGAGSLVLAKDGDLAERALVNPDRNNFAPRVGLAYRFGTKTVLRAGYGLFYQLFERYGSEDQMALNPPFLINNTPAVSSTATQPLFLLRNGFPSDFLDPAKLDLRRVRIRTVNPDSRNPSTHQWNFGFQHSLPWNLLIQADYVGTSSKQLTGILDLNQPINGRLPYPNFGYLEYRTPVGSGIYHGLDFSAERRFQAGLAFRLAYTWSKSIDNASEPLASGIGAPPFGNDFRRWRGVSNFNIPHRVVFSYVYELPFGKGKPFAASGPLSWIIGGFRTSGAFTYASGRPFTIGSGGSFNNAIDPFGAHTALPSVIGRPIMPEDVSCWYYSSRNAACRALAPAATDFLVQPALGTSGNLGRNTFRAPATTVFDFALHRDFPIRENVGLEFRWEVFNLTNTPLFGGPNGDFSSSAAGTITTLAGDPRVMQFALRLRF